MSVVLDASALLAALLGEPGADQVDAQIDGAQITAVNLAEVVGHFARAGADRVRIEALLAGLPLTFVPPDEALAVEAGMMRPFGKPFGLSLGDRFCLAHAKRTGATALTSDGEWAKAAGPLGVKIVLIR